MTSAIRIPRTSAPAPDEFAGAAQVTASDAKNGFGRVLDRVAKVGRLAITKHDAPCAVLLSMDEYRALVAAKTAMLETLSAEFDALYERMQGPGAGAAMQKAFSMTPQQLGAAAVKGAARAASAGVAGKPSGANVGPVARRRANGAGRGAQAETVTRNASPVRRERAATKGAAKEATKSARAAGVADATGAKAATGNVFVLAGCNGAGKSSIGGEALRQYGVDFFNPDEAAKKIARANKRHGVAVTSEQVNAAAWNEGRRLLLRTIAERGDFAFETTLGGATMTALLERALDSGLAVNVWFAGLEGVELHIDRVRRRVARGGHDIPVEKIRQRYEDGRVNLIRLMPRLNALYLYDNSREADPAAGEAPVPQLVLRMHHGQIAAPANLRALLSATPGWAKPIVVAALRCHAAARR